MIITKIFRFDAAHRLPKYIGVCSKLHGHTYILHVSVQGKVRPDGLVIDFKDLKKIVYNEVISKLDYIYINKIIKNPTAENLAIWMWKKLSKKLNLYEIKIYETSDSFVSYMGK